MEWKRKKESTEKVVEEKRRYQSKANHKEKEKCWNGEQCYYYRNNMCIFEHDPLRKEVAKEKVAEEKVAEQKVEEEKKRHQSKGYHKEKEKCRNGEHCSYYKNNMCMFEHDPTRKEEQKSKQERNHDNERPWEALKPTRRRWNGPNYRNDKRTPGHQKDDKERKLRDERQPRNDNHFLEEIVA